MATASFHVRIFEDLYEANDSLVVMAKGLGTQTVIRALVRLYCATDSLVLHLNGSADAQLALVEAMLGSSVALLPTVVGNEFSPAERVTLYARGGVLCITPRLLVVDMLCGRVPVERVTGLIVDNAHEVTDVRARGRSARARRATSGARARACVCLAGSVGQRHVPHDRHLRPRARESGLERATRTGARARSRRASGQSHARRPSFHRAARARGARGAQTSNVAFIVRLFRERNADGFVRAFSDDALALTRGMGRCEKALKLLRIGKGLSLWPRFQVGGCEGRVGREAERGAGRSGLG